DLLLTPTLGEPPLPLGTLDPEPGNPMHGYIRAAEFVPFTVQFNVSGQPAISLPLSWNADDLPIGSQLVAPYGREDVLLRVAAQVEQARPGAQRRPPVHAWRAGAGDGPDRRRPGLLRGPPGRGRRPPRRRDRLPLPRSAGRADAGDPAEGPPARRDARVHAR